MTPFVLDASVAAKWYLPRHDEPHVPEAFDLLRANTAGVCPGLVPDLFWSELVHSFVKAIRRKRIGLEHATAGLRNARSLDIAEIQSQTLCIRALALATAHGITGYDAMYVALAETTGAPLITADKRLADAVSASLPVRWLGAMQP